MGWHFCKIACMWQIHKLQYQKKHLKISVFPGTFEFLTLGVISHTCFPMWKSSGKTTPANFLYILIKESTQSQSFQKPTYLLSNNIYLMVSLTTFSPFSPCECALGITSKMYPLWMPNVTFEAGLNNSSLLQYLPSWMQSHPLVQGPFLYYFTQRPSKRFPFLCLVHILLCIHWLRSLKNPWPTSWFKLYNASFLKLMKSDQ